MTELLPIFKFLLQFIGLLNIGLALYASFKDETDIAFRHEVKGMLFIIWGVVL